MRKELYQALLSAGIYHVPGRKDHPLWQQAIELYKKESGDHEVNLNCGGCVRKIKTWLERE